MTVGAAGGLNVILKTIINPEDEVIVFAPFFGEYTNYVNNYDGKLVVIKPSIPSFQPNLDEFKASISPKTKAVIINTPNNPTGVIYSEETIKILAQIMNEKCAEYGTTIYLISDEPYRELVYGDVEVPYITKYYKDTIIGYSYSKSLSLPGERIGYLVIPSEMTYYKEVYEGACVANRILGFVNAPSLIQRAIMKCLDASVDVSVYDKNRIYIYENLSKLGFECVKPEGAFYLFIKAPTGDDKELVSMAKKYGILIVPGSSFGCPGYARLAYCVDFNKIEGSIEGFRMLAKDCGIHK
jgi:aspartate aminotransferase